MVYFMSFDAFHRVLELRKAEWKPTDLQRRAESIVRPSTAKLELNNNNPVTSSIPSLHSPSLHMAQ
jgi:hypothetical protein